MCDSSQSTVYVFPLFIKRNLIVANTYNNYEYMFACSILTSLFLDKGNSRVYPFGYSFKFDLLIP